MQYNAYEKDIAIVNIFFGEPTVYGKLELHITPKILEMMNYDHWPKCKLHNAVHMYTLNQIPIIPEFERSPKMTWLDFISGFGGLCGLCLGISFVSLAEIIYWFSIRLFRKF